MRRHFLRCPGLLPALLVLLLPLIAFCQGQAMMTDSPPYLDPARPLAERVQDLLSRMTRAEKISQMLHEAPAVPRLGIPAYNYWSEALHGVARNGRATVFPQAIGLAATWDVDLLQRVAAAIGDEARAKFHETVRRRGFTGQYQGLTFWSPNINLFRDPRWGRGQETYGEDPFLTGELGAAFVRGLQGNHPRYLKAAACAKHFAVHSGPEKDRHHFDARVSLRDLHDTYLPAFKKLVTEAGVEAVMAAYNRVNGEPCCASQRLLVEILRGQWQFEGHVVSDCWALEDIHARHRFTPGPVETAALALQAGCDLSCGVTYDKIGEAIDRGLLAEADLDRALARTLRTRFKLGLFDPPEMVPYTAIPPSVIGSAEHRSLALEAARKAIVLLKNQDQLLPIRPDTRKILVTGQNAASVDALLGNYFGLNDNLTTILEGIAGRAPEGMRVTYLVGTQLHAPSVNPQDWAFYTPAANEVVVACLGLSPLLEGEEGEAILSPDRGDRLDLALPPVQVEFLRKLSSRGAKIVLILHGGSPIILGEVENWVQAILFVWYPGEAGGQAVAEILFGDASPSGRLPITFPRSLAQLPAFEDYRMPGRTYRYLTAAPLYPFGYGLSYTQFAYHDLRLPRARIAPGESLPLQITVTNTGNRPGEEVVQFYLSDLQATVTVPQHKLIGFQRVALAASESKTLTFTITPEHMMLVDEAGEQRLEPGQFRLTVGGCSPGARGVQLGMPEPARAVFAVQ
ncbi:glycoside hydrolase family 3 C-terminal domain-containing protein [bacterium]|nr:glycoside hydrolase family 3 C-terminal domain-containing protein [bacterium]